MARKLLGFTVAAFLLIVGTAVAVVEIVASATRLWAVSRLGLVTDVHLERKHRQFGRHHRPNSG